MGKSVERTELLREENGDTKYRLIDWEGVLKPEVISAVTMRRTAGGKRFITGTHYLYEITPETDAPLKGPERRYTATYSAEDPKKVGDVELGIFDSQHLSNHSSTVTGPNQELGLDDFIKIHSSDISPRLKGVLRGMARGQPVESMTEALSR
jgi:hypothetical protein